MRVRAEAVFSKLVYIDAYSKLERVYDPFRRHAHITQHYIGITWVIRDRVVDRSPSPGLQIQFPHADGAALEPPVGKSTF